MFMMVGKRSVHSRAYTRKHKHKAKFYAAFALLGIVLLLGLTWWVTHKSPLVFKSITVQGAETTSAEDVTAIAEDELNRRMLIWSRNNFMLAPRDEIENRIEESFDWVKSAQVDVKKFSHVVIEITEYTPAYVLCQSTEDAKCFLADETGYIFAQDIYQRGTGYVVFRTGGDAPVELGTRIAPKAQFETVVTFIKGLADNDLRASEVMLFETGQTEVMVEGVRLIIDRNEDPAEMLGNFLLLLARETEVYESRQVFLEQTEYIDVRYGNKVFYKAKE